ncbi:SrtB family sortase, partial [Lachnoclostridium pacaense]|uniref:SpaA isopeptide-forming pilin-related protein n=1 Tax=Enterocloster hominis (ex Hitch et al. 2024) TaxID=1917870 RepID=UPI001D10DB8E
GQGAGESGSGDQGTGESGSGDQGTGESGSGDQGAGESGSGDQGAGESGNGDQGTGESGSGDQGAGESGNGDQGAGESGSGDQGAGESGSGGQGAGESGSGDQGAGESGSGDQGTGESGSGGQGAGESGSGDQGTAVALKMGRERCILMSSIATANDAEKSDETETAEEDEAIDEEDEVYEEYEYIRNPIQPSYETDISMIESSSEPQEEGNAVVRFFTSLLSDEDGDSVTASLPGFIDDSLDPMDVSAYGNPSDILYTFKVWDHRTEGRIHINKRDLELYNTNKDGSYGQTQGDGTLEGAVYGLFAAQDIMHPDGKSGVVYNTNDLVAVAATDKNGDASFLACTEKPGTGLDDDGNIKTPDGNTGPENLYNGSSITSSPEGFGTVTYPDYVAANGDQWIGRPLILGNYYIVELSRSEGYELSVNGISLTESNRTQDKITTVHEAGQAQVAGGLSDYNNMKADGSWNDFIIENFKTENGYDITISGYPEGADIYRVDTEIKTETDRIITGSSLQPKVDEHGNPVYQTAKGGEYKIGADGNPIIKTDTATDSSPDERIPQGETLYYRFRTAPYPSGSATPKDMSKWGQSIDADYLAEQVNDMLGQIGYKAVTDTSPWADVELTGATNALAAAEIMDWFTDHNFFDCGIVDSIYEKDGKYHARLLYDYSAASETYPAVYDSVNQLVYVHKTAAVDGGPADEVGYWIEYQKGGYSLSSKTVSIKEKREITGTVAYGDDIGTMITTVYQPVYEKYQSGEMLLDSAGNPVPVMERVMTYDDREVTREYEKMVPMDAIYDAQTGTYTIHAENTTDWTGTTDAVRTVYRAVTARKTIDHEGQEMPYNQYLTDIAGAGVSAYASIPPMDAGSYIMTQALVYPGQNRTTQDGGTQARPIQVLQRAIKQSIKVTKDISQASYDGANTYGSLHNDPLTVLLGLFNGGSSSQGTKILNQFKFKAYLKSNLEHIFVDDAGNIISEDIGQADFKGDVQAIYLPPKDGSGRQLLETKEDGTYDYTKFLDALYTADRKTGGIYPAVVTRQFAIDYYDVDAYKKEILAAEPGLNSDTAYDRALERAVGEAAAYLDIFAGLDDRLAIAWDNDAGGGADGDRTTLQCNTKNGKDDYYNNSIMLPYGTYVVAEQTPDDVGKELANRHFNKDYPKEITLPFVPDISQDGNAGETDVNYQTGSPYYRYDSTDTPEDLIRKYKIRFNEETHIIQAHSQDGDFEVYKYGLDREARPGHSLTSSEPYEAEYMDGRNDTVKAYYSGYTCQSEEAGTVDGVVYNGYETDSGQMEVKDNVPTMSGMQTAIDGKFAAMLVPWTVLAPAVDRVNPDTGNVETLTPSGSGKDFNFVAFAQEDFEDTYYSSRMRIEKLDAETGDNIIHDGALFKIYAAKREVEKNGTNTVTGTGDVLFGEAVDWEGNPVVDADGNKILYPRVGESNGSMDDLPVRLDKEGIPQYDNSQLIKQEDQDGNETGIFKAYSTVREVVIDGQVQKVPVGYIETYKPLGAGAYVLVEIQSPKGYSKSRPVAFEVYADDVTYYHDQRNPDGTTDGWKEETAARYQYAVPVTGDTNKFQTETVSQIVVEDYPSRVEIHKVEDGDSMVGNQNVLQKTDAQGQTEASGGFDGNITVNDGGDLLMYQVRGRKEKLEERGDVRKITYDPDTKDWYGYVTKPFDEYSENIVEGTEKALKAMPDVKLLYEPDGTYTGRGIRFDIPVSGARLSLYKAIELEEIGGHTYRGVNVTWEDGKVTGITNTNTGTHKEIRITGQDSGPASLDVWDTVEVDNPPVNLYFYDLDTVDTQEDPETDELTVLDARGNRLCHADSQTGMAYVHGDYGSILAYTVDDEGNKELVKSIQVLDDGTGQTIYEDKATVDDENGLPIYYKSGDVVTKDESWITDDSTDPYGTPETTGAVHTITRLPFGAYILQEETVPYDQGYIQARHMGLVLKDTDEVQKYFMQNEFTKTAFAKIDVRTQKEIQGATMTLYRAQLDGEGNPLKEEDGTYKKGDVYTTWISGCEYDDNGNLKVDEHGQPIPTTQPHWIDHIPVGPYVLEETVCPYEQGYVQSMSVNIDVEETGDVQSFGMEDDFTAIDIRKYDTRNGDVIYGDSEAWLTLYRAKLDDKGYPVIQDGIPQYDDFGKIFTFRAATYKDGQEIAATGRMVPDAGGNNPIMKYDYDFQAIPNTAQGRYYYTEQAAVRLEYLPIGSYVLVETGNPEGYATADPILIDIEEKGHLEEIQYAEMGDIPLSLEVSKVDVTGGKEVNGATLTIYPVDGLGNVSDNPLVLHQPTSEGSYQDITATWTSGLDGRYTEDDRKDGLIPPRFQVGDLRPHMVEYIPEGDYILREETTPYGFLQSVDVPFTITDTQIVQKVEMADEIPDGILRITKSDTDRPDQLLKGVQFQLENRTLNIVCGTVTTNDQGRAQFAPQPIGYMDKDGNFKPYTYICRETKAADGHMLTLKPYEFQFEYKNELTDLIVIEYNPTNDSNRVITDKLLGNTDELLEGVTLRVERRTDSGWETVDEWITGRQGHYTKDLQAGDYRLVEIKAADGFKLLAAPIEFTITDGMSEIPHLIMRNYSTIVDIRKVKSGTDTQLAGARLQLIKKDTGEVIREWTSENGGGQKFYGLEAGTYIIHELQAPSGYEKAADREIIVEDNNESIQVYRFENHAKSSGGGGGGDKPKPKPEYISFKKIDLGGAPVAGAEFTLYRNDGSVLDVSISDAAGKITFKRPEPGTYTMRETKSPEGYYLSDKIYSVTIGQGGVTGDYEIVNIPHTTIEIGKFDAETQEPLSGVELQILDDNNNIVADGQTDDAGYFTYKAPYVGKYHIKELEALEGYKKLPSTYECNVQQDGTVTGTTTLYNSKVQKIGKVIASYTPNLTGKGAASFGVPGMRVPGARTGDDTPIMLYIAIFIISLLSMIGSAAMYWRQKKKHGGQYFVMILGLVLGLSAGMDFEGGTVYAEEPGIATQSDAVGRVELQQQNGPSTLKVISEPYTDMADAPTPAATYEYDGITYRLQDYKVIEVTTPDREELASDVITYDAVEQADKIPGTAVIAVTDEVTGAVTNVTAPLKDYEYTDYRWVDGFEFLITVEAADAESYALGNILIPRQGENPFAGYENALLELINVNPEYYHIDRVEWTSDPWIAEDGVTYRQALASGTKQIATVQATYEGIVVFDAAPAQAIEAVYIEDVPEPTESENVQEETEPEITGKDKYGFWDFLRDVLQWLLKNPVVAIATCIALIIIICLIVVMLQMFAAKRKNKNGDDEE